MPVRAYAAGRSVGACQSLDTMVGTAYRRQRLFERTAREMYSRLGEAGIDLVFGVPNQNSLPGFLRNLEWRGTAGQGTGGYRVKP